MFFLSLFASILFKYLAVHSWLLTSKCLQHPSGKQAPSFLFPNQCCHHFSLASGEACDFCLHQRSWSLVTNSIDGCGCAEEPGSAAHQMSSCSYSAVVRPMVATQKWTTFWRCLLLCDNRLKRAGLHHCVLLDPPIYGDYGS